MPQQTPYISFPRIDLDGKTDIDSVRKAFSGTSPLNLAQTWTGRPENGFQQGAVHAGWCPDFLHVLAVLHDDDIVILGNAATKSRIVVGDVFQMFVDQADGEEYLEVHVTPDNQLRVLAWTPKRLEGFQEGSVPFEEILRENEPLPYSETWIDEKNALWSAYIRLPVKLWDGKGKVRSYETDFAIRASFCRFDASPELDLPVVSSTCTFPRKPLFHQREHWHRCQLAGTTAQ